MPRFATNYLFAVVGGVCHTNQVRIGPSIQICIFSTDMAVASIAWLALTAVHGIGKVPEVVTTGVFVAFVASIEAGITRRAHLQKEGVMHSFNLNIMCSIVFCQSLCILPSLDWLIDTKTRQHLPVS